MRRNSLIIREITVAAVVLLICASFIPSIGGINKEIESTHVDTHNPPYPPVMWTEDFETFYTANPKPDGDPIFYWIDWGDGTSSEWLGPYESNETVALSHIWSEEGRYQIKVKARNQQGESSWTIYALNLLSDFKFFHISVGCVEITYIFTIYWEGYEYFMFKWGDGTTSYWFSGNVSHAWSFPGDYDFIYKAKDIYGNESPWSNPFLITILGSALEIDAINGGLLRINTVIENTGSFEARDVNWSIKLEGGFILFGRESSGTIANIPADGEKPVSSDFIFGFGKTLVVVTADADGSHDVYERYVFIFLIFIFVINFILL